MQPDLVKEFVAAFNEEINRGRRDQELAVEARRRELARVAAKLEGLTNAIADGLRTPGLLKTLEGLEAQKAEIERAIEAAPRPHRASIPMSPSSIAARSRTCTRHSAPTTRAPRPPTSCAA